MTLCSASFTVRKPDKMLNMNDREHYRPRAGKIATWREAAFWWAKQHKVRCHTPPGSLVEMWVEFGTDRPNTRRDNSNFYPTIKAIMDGFTDAAVWPDDDSEHVHTHEPTFTTDVPADSLTITLTWETE